LSNKFAKGGKWEWFRVTGNDEGGNNIGKKVALKGALVDVYIKEFDMGTRNADGYIFWHTGVVF
jgi:hypothetical protein